MKQQTQNNPLFSIVIGIGQGSQPITSTFFTSIGKPVKGIFLSLTRQILFLLPLVIVLPLLMGIDGILYAGPIADGLAAVVTVVMAWAEFRQMKKLEKAQEREG